MPVRSSSSSVLTWPEPDTVREAVEDWARAVADERDDVLRIGYFGSYARGDAGVGSDIDLVVVVEDATEPWPRRAASWDTTSLPVPAELLVYTRAEWDGLDPGRRFGRMLREETRWVFERSAG